MIDGRNRILLDRSELDDPQVRATADAVADIRARLAALGNALRADADRDWEYAWVLAALARLWPGAGDRPRVLDVGGGNSPLCYLLAERGADVTVLDPDRAAVAAVNDNSRALPPGTALTAAAPQQGRWPFADAAFDAVVCVSVFEGILRRDRPRFWREARRALRPSGSLLLTFDYGADARFLGDPPTSLAEIEADIVRASGLDLVGDLPAAPRFTRERPPPIRATATGADGRPVAIAYTFAALHLRHVSS